MKSLRNSSLQQRSMFNVCKYLSAVSILLLIYSCSLLGSNEANYQYYKGFIGSNPVTMHLHKNAHQFSGVYWYDKIGKPIHFYGEDTSSIGNIILTSFGEDGVSEKLILKQADDKVSGTWISEKRKSRHLDILLNEVKEKFDFDYYSTDSTYTFQNGDIESSCSYKASFIWPKWSDEGAEFIQKDIHTSFSNEGDKLTDPETFVSKSRDTYIAEYVSMLDSMKNELEYLTSREIQTNVQVLYQGRNMLCTNTSFYQYDGGAHGMGGDFYVVYDLNQKRKINISEVLNASGIRNLPNLIERQIKRNRGGSSYSSLSDAGLFEEGVKEVSDNFYITSTGIGFVYFPYDIGPYSSGQFDVFFSYNTIQKYLQPSFMARVGIQ